MHQTRSSEARKVHAPDDPADRLAAPLEAILLTSDRPVGAQKLAESLGLVARDDAGDPGESAADTNAADAPAVVVRRAASRAESAAATAVIGRVVERLNADYAQTGRSFRIESVAGGFRLMTLPGLAPVLAAFHRTAASSRLSRAGVETLAIVAYRQPITRAQLESIRGVGCGEVLRSLLERRLVTIRGRAEELGRPILYGTTKEFLDAFGLSSLKDLPTPAEVPIGP